MPYYRLHLVGLNGEWCYDLFNVDKTYNFSSLYDNYSVWNEVIDNQCCIRSVKQLQAFSSCDNGLILTFSFGNSNDSRKF
jgi:hypothetical protein